MRRFIPRCYTDIEGGDWKPWPQDFGPPFDFYSRRAKRSGKHIEICLTKPHLVVHSLVTPAGYRWDCINGWTGKVTSL